jgi:hypothetical protein
MEPLQPLSPLSRPGRGQLGYDLQNTEQARQQAVHDGFDLVKQARRAGLEIRAIAQQAAVKSAALVAEARQARCSADEDNWSSGAAALENRARALQQDVAGRFRSYLEDVAQVLGGLQALNPPLTSEQLQPFMEAALADRQTTLAALDPFSRMMDLLRRWTTPGVDPDSLSGLA